MNVTHVAVVVFLGAVFFVGIQYYWIKFFAVRARVTRMRWSNNTSVDAIEELADSIRDALGPTWLSPPKQMPHSS